MEWLADNAVNGYFLLGFAAFMLAGVWWIQKQIVYLVGAGVALVLLLVFWLVIHNVPTTAKRIEGDLNSLAQALLAKEKDKAIGFVSADFKYNRKDRDKWYEQLEKKIAEEEVDQIAIEKFELKSRDGDAASVDFVLEAFHKKKSVYKVECPWKMVREGDVWQVAKASLHKTGGSKKSKDVDE